MNDVDFELELIHRDDINVAYIIQLLAHLHGSEPKERAKKKKLISDLLSGDSQLRSKKKLIEKFINENVLHSQECDTIDTLFQSFWNDEKQQHIQAICQDENVDPEPLQAVIGQYMYTKRIPVRDDIVAILKTQPKIRERKIVVERIIEKIKAFVETFIEGIG